MFSPSNKINREVGRAKDLSAPPVEDRTLDLNVNITGVSHQLAIREDRRTV